MKYKNLMAKALYDNVPESPEELAFRKGDILTVIEQNTGGLEGWWLCSLHGRQGIAPGNRLKLLIGPMFEAQPPAAQTPPSGPAYQQSPQQQGVYQVPQRSAWGADATPSKVVTPMRVGQSYTYDSVPRHQPDVYDVPPVRPQGVYDIPPAKQPPAFPGKPGGPRAQGIYDVPPTTQGIYDVPPTTQGLYNVPPTTQGVYDVPPTTQGVYDVPPTTQGIYSVPPCRNNPAPQEGNYDFPQPLKAKLGGIYDVPPTTTARPSAQSNYDFPPSSEVAPARGSAHSHGSVYDVPPGPHGGGGDVYDVPRGAGDYDVLPQEPRLLGDVTDGVNRLSFSSTGSARSSMSTSSSASSTPEPRAGAGPDLDSALQRLGQLQQGVEAAVSALLGLAANPHWRTPQFADEAQGALERVRAAVADLLAFGRVATAGAQGQPDRGLQAKLRRQLQRLEDSQQILLQSGHAPEPGAKPPTRGDQLDRFLMVSRTVPDDARQLASTVSGSAELLFRRAAAVAAAPGPLPQGGAQDARHGPAHDSEAYDGQPDQTAPFPVPSSLQQEKENLNHSEKCVKSWMEDYDYVHLQGKEEFERQQKELLEKENIIKQSKIQLEQEQLNQFKKLEQEVIKPVDNDITQWISHQHPTGPSPSSSDSSPSQGAEPQLCEWDRKLLRFYAEQCEAHFVTLLKAVDAFFGCISAGQPPRIFVAHSKFVILSAHKLVFIGDTLSRQATAPPLAGHVMNYSNVLCELLKTAVGATKTAALHYPNTVALQEMVDRVTDLSHQAQLFKVQLLQLANC
ncbi:enhancer of filamentation 1 isoform X3 [Anguilla anguilla]|uniref:enhancer of filamentation 1 isoform X3 n=1 Tax=Anguilla anguilla TaxID=7936 RepID=UPI0015B37709|nr:enhancer of filamentation 1 isoform X3 [Anguilla anguilla]